MAKVKRAIISVSDKNGIVDFAKELSSLDVDIISTGGTYKLLKESGVDVTEVSDVTGFPEMLDGRVKTLHPRVHAGILARRDLPEHMKAIAEKEIEPIDMVVVNLYPFKQTVLKPNVEFDDIVENIDIGGPSMIRAAAKNYKSVAVLTDPSQYPEVLRQLRECGGLDETLLSRLMAEAFVTTSNYDAMIAQQMSRRFVKGSPKSYPVPTEKVLDVTEGVSIYKDPFDKGSNIFDSEIVLGSLCSYEQILNLDTALNAVVRSDGPSAVVVKDSRICGKGSAETIAEALRIAFEQVSLSESDLVVCINRDCDATCVDVLSGFEVGSFICTGLSDKDIEVLKGHGNMTLLKIKGPMVSSECPHEKIRGISGGLVVKRGE